MNIILKENAVVLQGRAWEIRAKLKQYQNKYTYIREWIDDKPERTSAR
ncbi:Z-ring formation inhibitor MciZ [Bacillaceae bacterium SIJ1]|nr:Z-ring formation inhibitor MciZ [Litoribacterium kuwaitense]